MHALRSTAAGTHCWFVLSACVFVNASASSLLALESKKLASSSSQRHEAVLLMG